MHFFKKATRIASLLLVATVAFAPTALAADTVNEVNLPGTAFNETDAPLVVSKEIKDEALGLGTAQAADVNVHENPTDDAAVVTTIGDGQRVIILSKEGDWYWVNVGDVSGYVRSDLMELVADGSAELGYGMINCAGANIRIAPDAESETVSSASDEDAVTITGITNGWYQVEMRDGTVGYIRSDLVDPTAYVPADKIYNYAVLDVAAVNIRTAPDASAEKADMLYDGSLLTLVGEVGDWYQVEYNGTIGYIYAPLLTATNDDSAGSTTVETESEIAAREAAEAAAAEAAAAERAAQEAAAAEAAAAEAAAAEAAAAAAARAPEPVYDEPVHHEPAHEEPAYQAPQEEETYDEPEAEDSYEDTYEEPEAEEEAYEEPSYSSSSGQQIVNVAYQYLGVPYVWGGTSPSGFDCSGFVQYVFSSCGYSVSRTADYQYYDGYSVSYSNLQPGDLVFFVNTYATSGISHVGIYVGGGDFIHCASGGVKVSNLGESYYSSRYYAACRIAG